MRLLPLVCCLAFSLVGTAVAQTPTAAKPAAKPAAPKAASAKSQAASAKGARTVEITAGDTMKFDTTDIDAKRGETLHIVLKNVGTMPKIAMGHNFVLLKLGTDVVEFNTAAFNARETDFVPPSMKTAVIANTTLSGPGETVETTFKVPAAAGKYPFLCSFPGHFALGMRGNLNVK
ncbi:MAG: plastocyanin/azurin family copper-binding protein [Vicinamibacterales bacterium]